MFFKNHNDCTPFIVESFQPDNEHKENEGTYKIKIQEVGKKNVHHTINESHLVSKGNAIFVVWEEYACESERTDKFHIATKDYDKAKKCLDEHVQEELAFEKEEGYKWIKDEDEYSFCSYEEGYYGTNHYRIEMRVLEVE